jgi:hypothetical protein
MKPNLRERERIRRQHRVIALFGVIQAWVRGLDGIIFTYDDVSRLTGLRGIQHIRLEKMIKDVKVFFPYAKDFWTGHQNAFTALYVSRKPFEHLLEGGDWDHVKQVANLTEKGVKLDFLKLWEEKLSAGVQESLKALMPFFADLTSNDEKLLAAYLALLAQGQISVRSIPPLVIKSK